MLAQAKEVRPKLIVCGGSAYPRTVEADRFREIADEVGALLMTDMAHFAGLVAAGLHPNPVPHSHFVTSTTHKTLAGPRAGFVLCREEHAQALDRALFPGMQGGPLMHTIAAKATCFRIAATDAFRDYQQQVRANADALAAGLIGGGFDVLTGGTDTHLVQLDLRATEWTGLAAQERLDECRLTVNRNTVPFDERPPMVASGVRIGTPAATMRGFDEDDFREVAAIIVDALHDDADVDGARARGRRRSATAARSIPGFRGYTTYVDRETTCCGMARAQLRCDVSDRRDMARASRVLRKAMSVTEVTHPLVRHKLGLLRDVNTDTEMFRRLVNELTLLLTYEATKDMALEEIEVETPLERDARPSGSPGKKIAVCPILRAGMGMLDGVLSLIPVARVGFIGLYRNEETLEPVEYYVKLPADIAERDVLAARPDARDRQLDRRRGRRSSRTPARSTSR